MPRLRPVLKAALAALVALPLSLALLSCTGGGNDPSSPFQPTADGTYLRATFTLLDTGTPCRPGVACDPEFYSCGAVTGFTVPTSWSLHANRATAGALNYTPYEPPAPPNPALPGSGTIVLTGTDTVSNTSMSVGLKLTVDPVTSAVTAELGGSLNFSFANVQASCTELNTGSVSITQFGRLTTQPSSALITSAPVAGFDLVFADNGSSPSGGVFEGTFSFIGENRQEFGQVYSARVLVEGCFRLQVPFDDQGVPVDPTPATAACP